MINVAGKYVGKYTNLLIILSYFYIFIIIWISLVGGKLRSEWNFK